MNGPTVPPAIEMPFATPSFSVKYSLKIPTLCTYVRPMPKPISKKVGCDYFEKIAYQSNNADQWLVTTLTLNQAYINGDIRHLNGKITETNT